MSKRSAGILPYRHHTGAWEVLLTHPGGPFWAQLDVGVWSIAKGEYDPPEAPLDAAIREFHEETGHWPIGPFRPLAPQRTKSGKVIQAWATLDDWDGTGFVSNTFTLEQPKGSGIRRTFAEVDRIGWFDLTTAWIKIHPSQQGFIRELEGLLRHEVLPSD